MHDQLLLIEDHRDFRQALRKFLELHRLDVDIVEAISGEEAVLCARKTCFHIVVVGFTLCGINGLETARQIKQIHPDCRIILLSLFDPEDVRRNARKDNPITCFMHKDQVHEELVPVIRGLLAALSRKSRSHVS